MEPCGHPVWTELRVSRLQQVFAALVLIVWCAIYGRVAIDPTFHAPPEVSGVMLAVVTAIFGRQFVRKLIEASKNGDRDKDA